MLLTNTPLVHDGYHGQDCTHLSVTEIELCQEYQDAEWIAQIQAEQAAEMGYERHLENAGYWDAREQEDVEASRGVIQFEDAYAHALGYADAEAREEAEVINAQHRAEMDAQYRYAERNH
jgi:hypothetical protein